MKKEMLAVRDTRDENMRQKAAVPASYSFLPLFILVLVILMAASAVSAGDVFSWQVITPSGISAQSASGRPLKVTNERPLTVSFSFMVKGDVSKVRFTISRRDRDDGVTLLEETVKVNGNMAGSRLLLDIHRGVPLGRHDLYIQAFDAANNGKILTGKISYILLPSGSECMCQMVPVKHKSENTIKGGIEHA